MLATRPQAAKRFAEYVRLANGDPLLVRQALTQNNSHDDVVGYIKNRRKNAE